ncbi:MAG: fasciclin domain-containing protein [Candidatus Hydrogenedentes bacterium]|nr:fasciclin domain-containing protein [Candidatus Hydrogenedentota bacterium]
MKKYGLDLLGVAACLALAAILGWSALPTNAEGDTCPLKAAAAKAAGEKAGTCPSEAKNAKAGGTCPSEAKNASLAKDEKGGCCADKAAKPAVNTEGGAEPAAKLAADKDCGECPSAKNASLAANEKGECCKDGAKQVAAKDGACATAGECKDKDIAKLVKSDARFTTLALAVKAAGMEGEFQCPSAKTVLAPTNEAFQKLPAEQWAAILQDDAKLKALVANHIIKGAAMKSGCLAEAKHAKNANEVDLGVSQCPQSGKVTVGNAGIVGDALVASNGNVLVVDSVILPADMQVAKAESEEQVQVAAAK